MGRASAGSPSSRHIPDSRSTQAHRESPKRDPCAARGTSVRFADAVKLEKGSEYGRICEFTIRIEQTFMRKMVWERASRRVGREKRIAPTVKSANTFCYARTHLGQRNAGKGHFPSATHGRSDLDCVALTSGWTWLIAGSSSSAAIHTAG